MAHAQRMTSRLSNTIACNRHRRKAEEWVYSALRVDPTKLPMIDVSG